jgi:hypothetical protein
VVVAALEEALASQDTFSPDESAILFHWLLQCMVKVSHDWEIEWIEDSFS